jgi:undecaprenyl-diphosphatase
MTVLQSILLAVVEGVTEFLPISSTAHLVLTTRLLGIAQSDFVKSFEIIIQLGAILAVVCLYFKELSKNTRLWYRTILAFLPSAIIGFFLYDFIKKQLLGNELVTALALIAGGLVFMASDRLLINNNKTSDTEPTLNNLRLSPPSVSSSKGHISELSSVRLLAIGLIQSLAVIPGVSRSAASIFGGLLVGLTKTEATKFSFFLAIPTMLGATTLDLYKSQLNFSGQELVLLLIGFAGSYVTALFTIDLFIKFVQKHSFMPFGIYRIALGLFWLFAILKV